LFTAINQFRDAGTDHGPGRQTQSDPSFRNSRAPCLTCRWQEASDGALEMVWALGDATDVGSVGSAQSGQTHQSIRKRETNMIPKVKTQIEVCALSSLTGAPGSQPPGPANDLASRRQPKSRARAALEWIAIAIILGGTGFEVFICFLVERNTFP
jgi:hypothetical protein